MPKTKISEFSATPGNNTDIDGINIAEGCAPSGINDAIRELMAQLKDFQAGTAGDSFNGPVGTTTAAAGAFTNLSASGTFALTGDQVQISEGGTGQTTANAAFNALAPSQTSNAGKYLKTDGTNTSWDALDISTADITGTLPVANGGTGVTSSTGTGSVVLSASPTFTGTVNGASLTLSSNFTLSGGTANGVAYLNGSKVLTSGSALTFDGTNLTQTAGTPVFTVFESASGNNNRLILTQNSGLTTYNLTYSSPTTNGHVFQIGGAEQMRLTSTGLSIGTSSPQSKLHVSNTAAATRITITDDVANGRSGYIESNFSDALVIGTTSGVRGIRFSPDNTPRMFLDTAGNLGLGVTPSASAGAKAINIGTQGYVFGDGAIYKYNSGITNNAYVNGNGAFAAIVSRAAGVFEIDESAFKWHQASTGTAGSSLSLTQAMTLDASGYFLLGTTSASSNAGPSIVMQKGVANETFIRINHDSSATNGGWFAGFSYNGTAIGSITQNGTTAVAYNTSSDYRLKNITGPVTGSGAYIDSLKPVEGTWKADGSTFVGLLAHEAQEVSRTSVATGTKDGEEMQTMDYSNSEFIANIIAELQSLRARVAALETK